MHDKSTTSTTSPQLVAQQIHIKSYKWSSGYNVQCTRDMMQNISNTYMHIYRVPKANQQRISSNKMQSLTSWSIPYWLVSRLRAGLLPGVNWCVSVICGPLTSKISLKSVYDFLSYPAHAQTINFLCCCRK